MRILLNGLPLQILLGQQYRLKILSGLVIWYTQLVWLYRFRCKFLVKRYVLLGVIYQKFPSASLLLSGTPKVVVALCNTNPTTEGVKTLQPQVVY